MQSGQDVWLNNVTVTSVSACGVGFVFGTEGSKPWCNQDSAAQSKHGSGAGTRVTARQRGFCAHLQLHQQPHSAGFCLSLRLRCRKLPSKLSR